MAKRARVAVALAAAACLHVPGFAFTAAAGDRPSQPRPLTPISGPAAAAKLKAGKPLRFYEVTSPLILTGTMPGTVECTPCTFDKPFVARNVAYQRMVDLRDATCHDRVDLSGAAFENPVLFASFPDPKFQTQHCAIYRRNQLRRDLQLQPCSAGTDFQGPVSLSLATFGDEADLDSAKFEGPVDFSLARFRNQADFTSTDFEAPASFGGARFANSASFLGASFNRLAFDYVRTGSSDKSTSIDFDEADFSCTTDSCGKPKPLKNGRPRLPTPDAVFDFSVVDQLSFDHTTFDPGVLLSMASVKTSELVFDPNQIGHVAADDQNRILSLIESGAKDANDLGVANEAHYKLEAARSRTYPLPLHVLDFVFYRSIAGYLVEPLQPLLTLLALAIAVSLFRLWLPPSRRTRLKIRLKLFRERRNTRSDETRSKSRRSWIRRPAFGAAWANFCRLVHELFDTLSLMWPGSGASQAGRRLEANVYRILFVCLLIGVANSNPTLRQMLDALH